MPGKEGEELHNNIDTLQVTIKYIVRKRKTGEIPVLSRNCNEELSLISH